MLFMPEAKCRLMLWHADVAFLVSNHFKKDRMLARGEVTEEDGDVLYSELGGKKL